MIFLYEQARWACVRKEESYEEGHKEADRAAAGAGHVADAAADAGTGSGERHRRLRRIDAARRSGIQQHTESPDTGHFIPAEADGYAGGECHISVGDGGGRGSAQTDAHPRGNDPTELEAALRLRYTGNAGAYLGQRTGAYAQQRYRRRLSALAGRKIFLLPGLLVPGQWQLRNVHHVFPDQLVHHSPAGSDAEQLHQGHAPAPAGAGRKEHLSEGAGHL